MTTEAPLVGREPVLEELRGRARRAREGTGSLVLVSGEAGVGKTRTVKEALGDGTLPLLTAAAAETGVAPYGPVLDVIATFVRRHPGREAPPLVLPGSGDAHGPAAAFALAAAVRDAAAAIADAGAHAVFLDDLQWADEATLELIPALAEVAAASPLVIVAAYRSDELPRGHALRRVRTALRRARRLEELMLEPLDERETAKLAAALLGGPPAPVLAAAIWDRTQGLPFYVEEVAAALAESSRLIEHRDALQLRDDEDVPLPENVREVVLARLDGIDPEPRAAVEVAAVIGTVFELELLDALASRDGIEQAISRGLLVDRGDGAAAFRHALTREAIYAEITTLRRRDLHGRVRAALAARGAPGEVVARHAMAAGHTDEAVPLLLEAGEAYWRAHAHRDAARVMRQALDHWPGELADGRRLDALAQLARCLHLSGHHAEAARAWREVAELRGRAGDAGGVAQAQRHLGDVLDRLGRRHDALAAHAAAAAGFAELGRHRDAARARFAVGMDLHGLGSHAEAAVAFREVQELASTAADETLRLTGQAMEGTELARLGHVEKGKALAMEALQIALAEGHPEAAGAAYWSNAAILLVAGDYAGARSTLEEAVGFCSRTGDEELRRFCTSCLAYVLWRTGEWDGADELAELVRKREEDPYARAYAAVSGGSVAEARGDARRARSTLAVATAYAATRPFPPGVAASLELALARLEVLQDDPDAAADRCRRLLARVGPGDADSRHASLLRWAATLFAARGEEREARSCAALLVAAAGQFPHPEPRAAAAAAVGEVALLDGDAVTAAESLQHAVELLAEVELPFEQAQVRIRAADALSRAGDRDAAIDQLVAAYREARRLGARTLAADAVRALERLGERVDQRLSRAAAASARAGGLSRRELEVLRLVAVGRTNREIAQSLHLSTRTVDMHVRNVLSKLDCRTRTEAVAKAAGLGAIALGAAGEPAGSP